MITASIIMITLCGRWIYLGDHNPSANCTISLFPGYIVYKTHSHNIKYWQAAVDCFGIWNMEKYLKNICENMVFWQLVGYFGLTSAEKQIIPYEKSVYGTYSP